MIELIVRASQDRTGLELEFSPGLWQDYGEAAQQNDGYVLRPGNLDSCGVELLTRLIELNDVLRAELNSTYVDSGAWPNGIEMRREEDQRYDSHLAVTMTAEASPEILLRKIKQLVYSCFEDEVDGFEVFLEEDFSRLVRSREHSHPAPVGVEYSQDDNRDPLPW